MISHGSPVYVCTYVCMLQWRALRRFFFQTLQLISFDFLHLHPSFCPPRFPFFFPSLTLSFSHPPSLSSPSLLQDTADTVLKSYTMTLASSGEESSDESPISSPVKKTVSVTLKTDVYVVDTHIRTHTHIHMYTHVCPFCLVRIM